MSQQEISKEKVTRKRPRTISGVVVSDKMNKTRVIELKHSKSHGLYLKNLGLKRKIQIHDEKNVSKIGDYVVAASVRPISKNKNFRLLKVLETE